MTKKISQTPAAAPNAEAAWLAAVANLEAKRAAVQGLNFKPDAKREERIKFLDRKASEYEAIDLLTAAANAYAIALEGREPVDPDEAAEAAACDPTKLHGDLAALLGAAMKADEEAKAARASAVERLEKARRAIRALTSRRSAQGLPAPRALPLGVAGMQGYDGSAQGVLIAFEQQQAAPPARGVNAEPIAQMRREERTLRIAAERERLDEEQREAKREALRQADRDDYANRAAARQATSQAMAEAEAAKQRAEREEENRLADAHRARSAP